MGREIGERRKRKEKGKWEDEVHFQRQMYTYL